MSEINYSRQSNIFNKNEFNIPINIIGAGATGSWLALMLAKMGITNITVWDFDVVEEHNLPNQLFELQDVGEAKVFALQRIIQNHTNIVINVKNEKVTRNTRLSGIVFVLTDTMGSRKYIYESLKFKPLVRLIVETRMGGNGGYIYTINPMDVNQHEKYEGTFYSDEEAEVSACGTSISIVSTAINIASQAVWRLINYSNNKPNPFMSAIGLEEVSVYSEE